ncbi:MAG: hypothetical protein PHT95_02925 [Candidatus Omnitrophica bacterium]|jgi:hypothetical protein|nr:hypothetical protein [Candidatus Omnitrophota bacterium]MDD4012714.1 hypothetical protein [Candidatus Omnitrophota bacterium]
MLFKSKHANVIVYSSLVIALVMVSTLAGFTIYVQWKEDSFAHKYRSSIYKLSAEIFRPDLSLSNVLVKLWEDSPFGAVPVFEGSLKNGTKKTITAVTVEVIFSRPDGSVVYKDWVQPFGGQDFVSVGTAFGHAEHTRNILLPGEGMSFSHLLKNCPREVISSIKKKALFTKKGSRDGLVMEYSIRGVSFL